MKPEEYLIKDYGIIYDATFLKTKEDIVEYFKDIGADWLDCGQGYYEDELGVKVMTQDGKYYDVLIKAEIGSAKQDRGDRLYWVESIEYVCYTEIRKPKEKEKEVYTFAWVMTKEQRDVVNDFVNNLLKKDEV